MKELREIAKRHCKIEERKRRLGREVFDFEDQVKTYLVNNNLTEFVKIDWKEIIKYNLYC